MSGIVYGWGEGQAHAILEKNVEVSESLGKFGCHGVRVRNMNRDAAYQC